ncbi:MAG TPA: D-alanyl-D-alanine carboxypeptidase/D-alanyl-D-alanine-endopeptidase [Pyrinomonadaceae bacterium]|jgi:D-alanyl-D-alanine carboxypeptidase/D-alanyl-D-alanine-endopeptidase (penicillin-binding protein 4)
MKNKNYQLKLAGVLAFAIACFSLNFGITTAAQSNNRQRVIEKTTPTPKQTPTAVPTKPTATATPTLSPIASPTPVSVQTLADLQARIRVALLRPELRRGQVGLKIASLDTGKTIYEENAEKYFMPASNMKSFTIATALEKLSPDFRFITSVYSSAKPDASGVVRGLAIYGRGDVSFSAGFNDGDYYKGLEALADKIVQAGVKKIDGDLVGDESYFNGNPIPGGWEWDDLQWYYGAEISALGVNDNAVDLSVKPSAVNSLCAVQILPVNSIVKINNTCVTAASGTKRDIQVTKKLNQNIIEISGTMPADDKGYAGSLTVSHPSELFVELLRQVLEKKGVVVTGRSRVIGVKEKAMLAVASQLPPVEVARLESVPLSVVAAKTMKPSNNTYTETILWTLGQEGRGATITNVTTAANPYLNPKATSAEKGLFVVQNFLREVGISADSVVQWDGSGLSRHNLVTPGSLVQLYTYMAKQSRFSLVWQNSLTIAGVDGTLQNRFKGTPAAGNVRGKTGTIDQVSALSGYVTTTAGEKLVFSILVNEVPDSKARVGTIDMIVNALASFNGKTN